MWKEWVLFYRSLLIIYFSFTSISMKLSLVHMEQNQTEKIEIDMNYSIMCNRTQVWWKWSILHFPVVFFDDFESALIILNSWILKCWWVDTTFNLSHYYLLLVLFIFQFFNNRYNDASYCTIWLVDCWTFFSTFLEFDILDGYWTKMYVKKKQNINIANIIHTFSYLFFVQSLFCGEYSPKIG